MKTLKYISALLFSGLFFESILLSQIPVPKEPTEKTTFTTAVGLRGGTTSGLTIKQFTASNIALEGIIGIWPFAMSATILIEFYTPAGTEGLNWYYGFGGHAAFETDRIYYTNDVNRYIIRDGNSGIGIDGIAGIEYKILTVPISISLDLKPFIEINNRGLAYMALDPGLGAKFVF